MERAYLMDDTVCLGGVFVEGATQIARNCFSRSKPTFVHPQDVFTVSVGNLPPGASVLIKITYVAELVAEGEHILFSLPGSVAPWRQDTALDQTIQTDVEKVKVKKQRYACHRCMSCDDSCACHVHVM